MARTSVLVALFCCASGLLFAQDTHVVSRNVTEELIPAPACLGDPLALCPPETHAEWLQDLTRWRAERRIRSGLSSTWYDMPAVKWAQSSYLQPQLMVQDRYFYDPETRKYTVDRYLDDVTRRYGGIDSVLVWSTYPNMGIDDRNQLDMVASMPGGVDGVREMVAAFHRRGVKVLFPMMMWDQGTHAPEKPWPVAIAERMKQIDADGVNGDTENGVALAFPAASQAVGHPLAFEPENWLGDEDISWDVMGWGYYDYTFLPGIDRYRWLEPRHMVNVSNRWARSKTDDLQYAFLNGEGWESWENIWGIWNGITPRDGEAARRIATLERGLAPFLVSDAWEPLYPTRGYGVFASRWPIGDQTVWTIVNRNEYDVTGQQITVPFAQGARYFDLYHGEELKPQRDGEQATLSFSMEAHGFGAVLALNGPPDNAVQTLMATMKRMTADPLTSSVSEWKPLPQHVVEIASTSRVGAAPDGMVKVRAGDYLFRVQGIEIEGSNDVGVDVQYPWEDSARRFHERRMHMNAIFIDKYPVTNAAFQKFLLATHYRPADEQNFLKDWKDGSFPDGWSQKPVTWVSLEDARAYAAWAGKRLPHEWEWQYAAQGGDAQRVYPWGGEAGAHTPTVDRGRTMLPAGDVNAHPDGSSPFGVMDMVGNVWQWTDEYVDEHTRAAILRGGSHYQPQGSMWYFPQALRNDQHGKLLLMAPGYDRSGSVGFRCVKDAE